MYEKRQRKCDKRKKNRKMNERTNERTNSTQKCSRAIKTQTGAHK